MYNCLTDATKNPLSSSSQLSTYITLTSSQRFNRRRHRTCSKHHAHNRHVAITYHVHEPNDSIHSSSCDPENYTSHMTFHPDLYADEPTHTTTLRKFYRHRHARSRRLITFTKRIFLTLHHWYNTCSTPVRNVTPQPTTAQVSPTTALTTATASANTPQTQRTGPGLGSTTNARDGVWGPPFGPTQNQSQKRK